MYPLVYINFKCIVWYTDGAITNGVEYAGLLGVGRCVPSHVLGSSGPATGQVFKWESCHVIAVGLGFQFRYVLGGFVCDLGTSLVTDQARECKKVQGHKGRSLGWCSDKSGPNGQAEFWGW